MTLSCTTNVALKCVSEDEEDFKAFQDGMCGSKHVCTRIFLCCVSQNEVRATMVCAFLSFLSMVQFEF
jgi:hypothetical protein